MRRNLLVALLVVGCVLSLGLTKSVDADVINLVFEQRTSDWGCPGLTIRFTLDLKSVATLPEDSYTLDGYVSYLDDTLPVGGNVVLDPGIGAYHVTLRYTIEVSSYILNGALRSPSWEDPNAYTFRSVYQPDPQWSRSMTCYGTLRVD